MQRQAHTTKSGPGRLHVEGTYRGGKLDKSDLPAGEPGDKLRRQAAQQLVTLRGRRRRLIRDAKP